MAKRCTETECPLIKKIEVPYSGNTKARIVFFGESPGKTEEEDGKPFRGDSGKLAKQCCRKAGLNWLAFFIMNSARCRILKKDLPQKTINLILSKCRPNVEVMLKHLKPKVIILSGDYALKQVLRKSGITKARGKWVWSDEFNCWCLPTFHPAYVLRNMSLKPILIKDFKLVADFVRNGNKPPDDMDVSQYDETDSIQEIIDQGMPCAIDTESQGLDWISKNFVGIGMSISNSAGTGTFMRLYRECAKKDRDFTIQWPRLVEGKRKKEEMPVYVQRMPEFDRRLDEIQYLVEKSKIKLYMMNGNHDVRVLRAVFRKERKHSLKFPYYVMDIQAAAHLLDENLFKYANLELLQRMFTDVTTAYKTEFDKNFGKDDMLAAPEEEVAQYASADGDVTYQASMKIREKVLAQKKLAKYYVRFLHPTLDSLREMEENGAWIDQDKKNDPKEGVEVQLERMIAKDEAGAIKCIPRDIRDLHRERGLKLTRKDLVKDAIFSRDGFHLKPVKRTKTGPSIDKEARLRLKDGRMPDRCRRFIEHYESFSEAHTLLTRYIRGFDKWIRNDGRIHTSYSIPATVTGRVASSGPNMMNNPKRSKLAYMIRQLIAAPKGWRLLAADKSQSELRWMAEIANEPSMKRVFASGLDIHTETAKALAGRPWNAVSEKEQKDFRRKAKTVNFGLLYGMQLYGFIRYAKIEYGLNLSEDEASVWIEIFFRKYPRLRKYHLEEAARCRRLGYVESPLGRRRHLPEIHSQEDRLKHEAERQAINSPTQSASSDCVMLSLNELRRKKRLNPKECRPILFVHDELVFEVRDKDSIAEKYAKIIKEEMEDTRPLKKYFGYSTTIPHVADVEQGYNYSAMSLMTIH